MSGEKRQFDRQKYFGSVHADYREPAVLARRERMRQTWLAQSEGQWWARSTVSLAVTLVVWFNWGASAGASTLTAGLWLLAGMALWLGVTVALHRYWKAERARG